MDVSWSKIKTWRRCHKQYDYKYNQMLVKKKPPLPLVKGKMVGECLDLLVDKKPWRSILAKYESEYGRLFREEREYYGDIIAEVESIVSRYQKHYANEKFTYLKGKHGKRYELPVEVELSSEIRFIGYIDKMPRDSEGRVWIQDHKAVKQIPDEDSRFSDLQLVFYAWASPLSGYPEPAGVIWDYIRTKIPAKPQLLKSGELSKREIETDYDTYLEAIKENGLDPKKYSDILESLKAKTSPFFRRVKLPSVPKPMVEQVVRDMRNTAEEIRLLGEIETSRNMTRDCKLCQYYSLCQAELRGLNSQFIRETEYIVKEPTSNGKAED